MKWILLLWLCVAFVRAQLDPAEKACLSELLAIVEPQDTQHIEMLDYTGKAIGDLGNYDECLALPANLSQYCYLQTDLNVRFTNLSVYLGICAPANCTADSIHKLIVKGAYMPPYNISSHYPIVPELDSLTVYCQPRIDKPHYSGGAIFAMFLFSFFAVLVLAGTVIEYYESQVQMGQHERDFEERKALIPEGENGRAKSLDVALAPAPANGGINSLPGDGARVVYVPYDTKKSSSNKGIELIKCFAIGTNMKFLLQDNRGGEIGLAAMNGLRVLMMGWIILGHTLTYLLNPVGFDNIAEVETKVIRRVSFQVVPSAELAVDVFFYISGFLVVYMVLKEMKQRKGKGIPWGLFYFHRYWRLTPVYGLIIFFYATLTPYMVHGPFAHLYRDQKTSLCDKYWWTNMIYINNFYPSSSSDACLGWGWYLANDMQFFIFTPLIVLLFNKSRKAAWALLLVLIAISMGLTAFLVGHNHLAPLNPGDNQWMSTVYDKPYTRMAPYLIGIGFAFLVQYEIDLARNWMVRWAAYAASATTTTCATYLIYGFWQAAGWANWQNVVYATFVREGFVLGVGWFMYACYKQHGGVFRTFLGAYIWIPLARLTYTAYLLHPILMFIINYNSTAIFHYSPVYAAVRYSSHLFLAYMAGLVFHLAIEKPTANVERIFLPNKKKH